MTDLGMYDRGVQLIRVSICNNYPLCKNCPFKNDIIDDPYKCLFDSVRYSLDVE